MLRLLFVLGVFLFVESSCKMILHRPTHIPPRNPIYSIRTRIERAADAKPLFYEGDNKDRTQNNVENPILPNIIDNVKLDNTRYARSLPAKNDKPLWIYEGDDIHMSTNVGRPFMPINDENLDLKRRYVRNFDATNTKGDEESASISTASQDTEVAHPGYNHRNTRAILPYGSEYFTLPPYYPTPYFPSDPYDSSLLYRQRRDVHISNLRDHEDFNVPKRHEQPNVVL